MGEFKTETRYYSKEGKFKGAYINFNTPVELYPSKIRYTDLEVDICVLPGSNIKILDMEMLERAASELVITRKLFEKIKTKVNKIQYRIKDKII